MKAILTPLIKPFDYQGDALTDLALARISGEDKGLLDMASGLGKTVIAALDVGQFFNEIQYHGRALFLCHLTDVVDQAQEEFKEVYGDQCTYGLYHGKEKTTEEVTFLFASFQTMRGRLRKFAKDYFDYIIVDEAHHAPAKTFRAVIDYFQPKFLLGMTATSDRPDNLDLNVIFGPTAYVKSLPRAVGEGRLVKIDTRIIMDELAKKELKEFLDKDTQELISMGELNRRVFIPLRDEEIVRIIREKAKEKKDPRTVLFCCSILHAKEMAALVPEATVLHSDLLPSERKQNLQAFRDGTSPTIIVVNMLDEGIDVPEVNIVALLHNTESIIKALQRLGRGTRLSEGKDSLLVLDFAATCETILRYARLRDEINKIHPDRIKVSSGSGSIRSDEERFSATIDDPEFIERALDIIALLEQAEQRTRQLVDGYTEEELIVQLRKKYIELGKTPLCAEIEADPGMASVTTFIKVFGSYVAACKAAGLEPNQAEHRTYTRDDLITQFVVFAEKNDGKAPICSEIDACPDMASSSTFLKVFGSIRAVCIEAGLESNDDYTKEELGAQLLAKSVSMGGKTPSKADVDSDPNMASSVTYANVFGSYSAACLYVKLEPNLREYTREDAIALLKAFSVKNDGKAPNIKELKTKNGLPSQDVFIRLFGSYTNACLEAELGLNYIPPYNREDLAKQMRKKLEENGGYIPSVDEVDNDPEMAHSGTFRDTFGSIPAACKEAVGDEFSKLKKRPLPRRRPSREALKAQILEKSARMGGVTPSYDDVRDDKTMSSIGAFVREFGNWSNACLAAGLAPNKKSDVRKKSNQSVKPGE
ncbi:DEAD/DEAH box helicase [Candidatus Saccharibacteria bacterium]|nr:DEAD/DEAH box helicase [Candidatus Saccharibacteria bacterium]